MGFPSRIGQVLYGGLTLFAIVMVLASIFTPGWRELAVQQYNYGGGVQQQPQQNQMYNSMYPVIDMGLFQFACWSPNQGSMYSTTNQYGTSGQYGTGTVGTYNQPTSNYGTYGTSYGSNPQTNYMNPFALTGTPLDYCIQWFRAQPGYEKAVLALAIIALIVTIVAFLWNLITFCQCRPVEHRALPVLSGIAAVFLIIALIVFGSNNSSAIQQLQQVNQAYAMGTLLLANMPSTSYVAYSFYLSCIGAVSLLVATVVGALIACCDTPAV